MSSVHITLGDDIAIVEQCESIFEPHDCELVWRERIPTIKHGSTFMWVIEYDVGHVLVDQGQKERCNVTMAGGAAS
jgi:hypothetical protein